jgi:hypothetical protein
MPENGNKRIVTQERNLSESNEKIQSTSMVQKYETKIYAVCQEDDSQTTTRV